MGARYASGSKLLFIDADDEVALDYVSKMAVALDLPDFVTAAFDQETLYPRWVRRAHGPPWRDRENPLPAQLGVWPNAEASICLSRSAFEAVGRFPEDLPHMQDIALSCEVQLAGFPLCYGPDVLYRVRYRDRLTDLFRQGWRSIIGAASVQALPVSRYAEARTLRSWARLAVDFSRARTKADLSLLMVGLGRQIGRINGSIRHRVFFP